MAATCAIKAASYWKRASGMSSARRANDPSPALTFLKALLACSLMFTLTGFLWFGPGADDNAATITSRRIPSLAALSGLLFKAVRLRPG